MPTSCSGELLLGIDDMLAPSTGEKLFLADLGGKSGRNWTKTTRLDRESRVGQDNLIKAKS